MARKKGAEEPKVPQGTKLPPVVKAELDRIAASQRHTPSMIVAIMVEAAVVAYRKDPRVLEHWKQMQVSRMKNEGKKIKGTPP